MAVRCLPQLAHQKRILQAHTKTARDRCLLALLVVAGGGTESTTQDQHCSGSALRRSSSLANSLSSSGSAAGVAAASGNAGEELVVHMADFGRLLKYVGPLNETFLERLEALLRKDWFWGDLPTAQAEALVQKNGRGSFLVRFSSSDIGGCSITVQR